MLANSPFAGAVQGLLDTRLGLSWKFVDLSKPLVLWINDGLMALFFLLVGLEIKREVVEGSLSQPSQVALPIAGAIGGMAVPAALYVAFNWSDPVALRGWAIPAATDIAFSLGVLAALGSRVPLALKVFLTTLAIVDDLGSILIIAIFYTHHLSRAGAGARRALHRRPRDPECDRRAPPRALSGAGRAALGLGAEVGRACHAGGRRARPVHSAQVRRRGRGRRGRPSGSNM